MSCHTGPAINRFSAWATLISLSTSTADGLNAIVLLDFGVLLLPAGLGLIALRSWARKLARVFAALMLLVLALVAILAIAGIGFGRVEWFGEEKEFTSPLMRLAVLAPFAAYTAWQYWVVARKSTKDLFDTALRGEPKPLIPRRFSLATLLLVMALASFVMYQVTVNEVYYERHVVFRSSSANEDGLSVIGNATHGYLEGRYGKREKLLEFVVFEHSSNGSLKSVVTSSYSGGSCTATIVTPRGRTIELFSNPGLYEFSGSELLQNDEKVTYQELDDYLSKGPPPWSIEGLLKSAEEQRTKGE